MTLRDKLNFKNKIILLTGGLGNLGKAFTKELINLDANVIICDNKSKSDFNIFLKTFETHLRSKIDYIKVNLLSKKDRNSLIKKINKLDILINNASLVGDSRLKGWNTKFHDQSISSWSKAFEINLTATFHLCRDLSPLLMKNKKGIIINISSIYGLMAPDIRIYKNSNIFNPAAYSASKSGLINLTKWLAVNLAPHIRVNCISPGGIIRNQDKSFINKYNNRTPLNRMATEEDIVDSLIFLTSDMSRYINGHNLVVDGGFSIF